MSGGRTSASKPPWAATMVAALLAIAACSTSTAPQAASSALPSGPGWKVENAISIGGTVGAPVAAGGLTWVPDMAAGKISAVDAGRGRVVHSITIGDPHTLVAQGCGTLSVHSTPHGSFFIRRCDLPSAMAYDGSSLWVTANDKRAVLRLDPTSGRVLDSIPVDVEAFGMAVGGAGVWVTDYQDGSAVHIDRSTGKVLARVTNLPPGPSGVVVGSDAVWITCARAELVVRVDPVTNRVVAEVPVGRSPLPVTLAFGSAWVRSEESDTLTRIDPATNQVLATIPVGSPEGRDGLDQFAVDHTGLWLSGFRLEHVDAATNRVDRTLTYDGVALDYASGSLLATDVLGTLSRIRV